MTWHPSPGDPRHSAGSSRLWLGPVSIPNVRFEANVRNALPIRAGGATGGGHPRPVARAQLPPL